MKVKVVWCNDVRSSKETRKQGGLPESWYKFGGVWSGLPARLVLERVNAVIGRGREFGMS